MIKIEDYVVIIKNVLSKNVCGKIIKDKKNPFIRSGVMGNKINECRTCYEKRISKDFNDDIYKGVGKILEEYKNMYPNFMTGHSMEDTGYKHLLYMTSSSNLPKNSKAAESFWFPTCMLFVLLSISCP